MTKDHVFPKSKGGWNDAENLQTMCVRCNGQKASMPRTCSLEPSHSLRDRWSMLWRRVGVPNEMMTDTFRFVVKAYSQTCRRYHNLMHLINCLAELDEASGLLEHQDEAEAAIWFHDVIYNPLKGHNEAKSAEAMRNKIGVFVPKEFVDRVSALILCTDHKSVPPDIDSKVVVDADLAILGAPTPAYDEFERGIREEYAKAYPPDYLWGRSVVLKGFLERPSIYYTSHFYQKYEVQARANLTRAIRALEWELLNQKQVKLFR